MTFLKWDSYVELLDKMYQWRADWYGEKTIEDLTRSIREKHRELVGSGDPELGQYSDVREWGYASLVTELEHEFLDPDVRFEQIRLTALSRPAAEAGMGPEWEGCYLSERADGVKVYSYSRFAEASEWYPVDEPGGTAPGEQASGLAGDAAASQPEELPSDLRQQHFDAATGRWRRFVELDNEYEYHNSASNLWERVRDGRWCHYDGTTTRWRYWVTEDEEYEYYDSIDQLWERAYNGNWYRYHSARFGWLAYDRPSKTWLDSTLARPQWRSHQEIGTPVPGPVDDEEVVAARKRLQAGALKAAEEAGLVPNRVSAEDWRAYFDKYVLTELKEASPRKTTV